MTTNEIEEIVKNIHKDYILTHGDMGVLFVPRLAYVQGKSWVKEGLSIDQLLTQSLLAYGEKCRDEERERIKEVISIEIEAWFGAHDEMEKSFMSEDMIKQIIKRMEEI